MNPCKEEDSGFAGTGQAWNCCLCTYTCYLGAFLNLSEVSLLTRHSGTIPHLTVMVRSEGTQYLPKASAGWALSKGSSPHYAIDRPRRTASGDQCGRASHFSLTRLLVHRSLPSFPVSPQPLSPGFRSAGSPTCWARPGEICPPRVGTRGPSQAGGSFCPSSHCAEEESWDETPGDGARISWMVRWWMGPGKEQRQEDPQGCHVERLCPYLVMRVPGTPHPKPDGVWLRPCVAATMTLPEPAVSLGPQKAPPRWASCPRVGQNDISPCKPHPLLPS